MATTLTVIASGAGRTALNVAQDAVERFAGQAVAGFQNLGTIDKISGSGDESTLTHSRQRIFYDPVGDIVYVVGI